MKVENMVKLKEEFDYKSMCRRLENELDRLIAENERQQKGFEDELTRIRVEAQNHVSQAEKSYSTALEVFLIPVKTVYLRLYVMLPSNCVLHYFFLMSETLDSKPIILTKSSYSVGPEIASPIFCIIPSLIDLWGQVLMMHFLWITFALCIIFITFVEQTINFWKDYQESIKKLEDQWAMKDQLYGKNVVGELNEVKAKLQREILARKSAEEEVKTLKIQIAQLKNTEVVNL